MTTVTMNVVCVLLSFSLVCTLLLYPSAVCEQSCSGQSGNSAEEEKRAPPPKHYNIILLGATGDLAKKYLWNGFFTLFTKHYIKGKTAFHIYACGLSKPDDGRTKLSNILLNLVQCGKDKECQRLKADFIQVTRYHQLKTSEHYRNLASKIEENSQTLYGLQGSDQTSEDGRLIYLSIPPSAYTKTTKLIHQYLRPGMGRPWLKIVLEKPFGYDKESAVKLAKHLANLFKEDQIYRVDHYLGKPLVKNILPFRQANRDLYGELWNSHHIDRVEIAMQEKLDCKGRTEFYDEVGVVRDVMQNHLTEIMTLVAMELPPKHSNIQAILRKKQDLLNDILPLEESSTVTGQYETYATEVQIESKMNNGSKDDFESKAATFAATVMYVNNARWRDVPFVLMSGKKLEEKASYVKIVFKNNRVCATGKTSAAECNKRRHLMFVISTDDARLSNTISISKSLRDDNHHPRPTLGWKLSDSNFDFPLLGEDVDDSFILVPDSQQPDAYTTLIEAVYEGQRHLFTNTDNLISSWDIWSKLVKKLDNRKPRKYLGGGGESFGIRDEDSLLFQIVGKRLEFVNEVVGEQEGLVAGNDDITPSKMQQIPSDFRGRKVVVKPLKGLVKELAGNIESSALSAIDERGTFHLALPGGFSPRPLLTYIANEISMFPWKHTHIWQVDERCVETKSKDSNFKLIQDFLLNSISIPHGNVHPMPVHLLEDLCDAKYNGDLLYEAIIKRHVLNQTLDFIVLGMGQDGHTASLFPQEGALEVKDKLVTYTEVTKSKVVSPKRMTMTFSLINSARNVSVLATGKGKHEVLKKISGEDDASDSSFPVTKVDASKGDLTWYIDYDAFFG